MSGPKRGRIRHTAAYQQAQLFVRMYQDLEIVFDGASRIDEYSSLCACLVELRRLFPPHDSESARTSKLREDFSLGILEAKPRVAELNQALNRAEKLLIPLRAFFAAPKGEASSSHGITIDQLASAHKKIIEKSSEVAGLLSNLKRMKIELELLSPKLSSKTILSSKSPHTANHKVNDSDCEVDLLKKARHDAELIQLRNCLDEVKAQSTEIRDKIENFCGNQSRKEFNQAIENCTNAIAAENIPVAKNLLEEAKKQKAELLKLADKNKEAREQTEKIADAIMQALVDKNFNTPIYGDLDSDTFASGIQIRAEVPSKDGKGNIRIDLHLSGEAEIEVENVPSGEEIICRNLLTGVAEALAKEGLELEMTDWGRATNCSDSNSVIKPIQSSKEREAEKVSRS